ncbi:MAG: PhzF family phenazine biosynthesis protein [Pseudomonadota bacterium]
MKRRFHTLDVFTDQSLAGNPLAVVLDSDGLNDESMQAIATEFNLSETVFVRPPETEVGAARIRIFTPVHELPFAGHPTVGTAILLSQLNHLADGAELVLEENVGPVKCVVSDQSGTRTVRFGLPKVSEKFDWESDNSKLAEAIGLDVSDIGFDDHSVSIWDGGVPYMLVPLATIDAVRNISINSAMLKEIEPLINGIHANVYAYCPGGENSEASFHARMFAPFQGIPEDPATGSAVASLSGQLASCEFDGDRSKTFLIEQGFEMGRPSQIYLDIQKQDGKVVDAGISGAAVRISEGVLDI